MKNCVGAKNGLRTLTNLLTDVPWQARPDGAFAQLQPAWENYTGQTWDAHAGHGWFDAIHADDRGEVQASWSAACFAAQPYEHRARLWHAQQQSVSPGRDPRHAHSQRGRLVAGVGWGVHGSDNFQSVNPSADFVSGNCPHPWF